MRPSPWCWTGLVWLLAAAIPFVSIPVDGGPYGPAWWLAMACLCGGVLGGAMAAHALEAAP